VHDTRPPRSWKPDAGRKTRRRATGEIRLEDRLQAPSFQGRHGPTRSADRADPKAAALARARLRGFRPAPARTAAGRTQRKLAVLRQFRRAGAPREFLHAPQPGWIAGCGRPPRRSSRHCCPGPRFHATQQGKRRDRRTRVEKVEQKRRMRWRVITGDPKRVQSSVSFCSLGLDLQYPGAQPCKWAPSSSFVPGIHTSVSHPHFPGILPAIDLAGPPSPCTRASRVARGLLRGLRPRPRPSAGASGLPAAGAWEAGRGGQPADGYHVLRHRFRANSRRSSYTNWQQSAHALRRN